MSSRKILKPTLSRNSKGGEKAFKWNEQKEALVEIRHAKKRNRTGRLDDFNSVLESLPTAIPSTVNTKSSQMPHPVPNRNKKIVFKKELEHFQKVLAHPAFKSNALNAISAHIATKQSRVKDDAKD